MIPQRDLSLLSNRLAERGGRCIPETVLEVDAVVRKLEFRGLTLAQVSGQFAAKETRLRNLWQVRLAAQMAELSEFDAVYREVRRALRQGGFSRG